MADLGEDELYVEERTLLGRAVVDGIITTNYDPLIESLSRRSRNAVAVRIEARGDATMDLVDQPLPSNVNPRTGEWRCTIFG